MIEHSEHLSQLIDVRIGQDKEHLPSFSHWSELQGQEEKYKMALSIYRLAKLQYDKSDLLTAEELFLRALPLWESVQEFSFHFKTLGFLVRVASEKNETHKISHYTHLAEQLLKDGEYQGATSELDAEELLYNHGIVCTYRGDFAQAHQFFLKSYKKSLEQGKRAEEQVVKTLYSLAYSSFHLKDFDRALLFLQELNDRLVPLNKYYLQGTMHLLFGHVYFAMDKYQDAIGHYKRARQILHAKTCWNLLGQILYSEGLVFKAMGQMNQALFFFEFALNSIDQQIFRRLAKLLLQEIENVNNSTVDMVLDRANRMIYESRLGPIDFKHRFVLLEILFLLAQNPGQYFDKEKLAKSIWKDEYNPLIHDKLIYTSVSRLRKLIEPKNNRRTYIIRGKEGYMLSPTVKIRFHRQGVFDEGPRLGNIDLSTPL